MSIAKPNIVAKTDRSTTSTPIAQKVTAADVNELRRAIDDTIDFALSSFPAPDEFKFISARSDFPAAVEGVITLAANTGYWITGDVDLLGQRLVCSANTVLIGSSSENSILRSTGLTGTALITSEHSLPMRHLAITADVALNLNGDGTTTALDWFGVNFVDCNSCGTIANYTNFIAADCGWLNSGSLTFDGAIGTVGFSQSIFVPRADATAIVLPSTLTISRRFRVIYSAFVVTSGKTGINVSTDATIPVEGYILDTVNFAGGGTYTAGVTGADDKASFIKCVGVLNSSSIATMYMNNNATETVVTVQGDRYPVLGTTAAGAVKQRFTHLQDDNAVRYDSTIPRTFKAQVALGVTGPNNAIIGLYIAVKRSSGALTPDTDKIDESEVYLTTGGTRPDAAYIQALVTLNQNDRVYCLVQNTTGTGNVTVASMNLIITEQA